MNIVELFYLRLLLEKIPERKAEHVHACFYMLRENRHFEISEIPGRSKKHSKKIIRDLIRSNLVRKEGCLVKINEIENLITE